MFQMSCERSKIPILKLKIKVRFLINYYSLREKKKAKLLQGITGTVEFLQGKEVRSNSNYWLQMFT